MTPSQPDIVRIPAPTAWPIVLAAGVTLIFAGLVTSVSVTVLGGLLAIPAAVGWFRNVLPVEVQESVRVVRTGDPIFSRRRTVAHYHVGVPLPRARLPLEVYPLSAGVKGGLAGGAVMAAIAMIYGIASGTSVWYPINLIAAEFFPRAAIASTSEIAAFHGQVLLVAITIHLLASLLVGLLFGATLPMLPRRPILLGGLIAPIVWSAVVHSVLDAVNPVMNQRVDWPWFVLSQVGFGIAAGLVVAGHRRVPTSQYLPLAVRAGIEMPGLISERKEDER